jgi:hypothetical protein
MAFGSKKTIRLILVLAAAWTASAETLRWDVRHVSASRKLIGKTRLGTLEFGEEGLIFEETGKSKKPMRLNVPYREVQQFTLAPERVQLRLYEDSSLWKLGADKVFTFDRPKPAGFDALDAFLRPRLEQRLASAVPHKPAGEPLWSLAVKHHRGIQGSQGTLRVGKDWISYSTEAKGDSRFWRFADIENVSSTSPFELILTTYERSRYHHGGFKIFRFQLKQRLSEERYEQLWNALEKGRQSNILEQYTRKGNGL